MMFGGIACDNYNDVTPILPTTKTDPTPLARPLPFSRTSHPFGLLFGFLLPASSRTWPTPANNFISSRPPHPSISLHASTPILTSSSSSSSSSSFSPEKATFFSGNRQPSTSMAFVQHPTIFIAVLTNNSIASFQLNSNHFPEEKKIRRERRG